MKSTGLPLSCVANIHDTVPSLPLLSTKIQPHIIRISTALEYSSFYLQSCPTLWTEARQAPLSLGFFQQERCSELPCPAPGYIPDPGIKPMSLKTLALADGFFTTSTSWEAQVLHFAIAQSMDVLSSLVFKIWL